MSNTDNPFPRGGSLQASKRKLPDEVSEPKELFTQRATEGGEGQAKKKRRKLTKEGKEERKQTIRKNLISSQDPSQNVEEIDLLTNKTIAKGMIMLARVNTVTEKGVVVSLGAGLTGYVKPDSISSAYGKEGVADDESSGLEKMFYTGQMLRCVVKTDVAAGHKKIHLSIKPEDVNAHLKPKYLRKNLVLSGAVKSVEERGYVIDLGVRDVRAFLSQEDADTFDRGGHSLVVGSNVFCKLKSDATTEGETSSLPVTVTIDPREVNYAVMSTKFRLPLPSLQPGMLVQATVVRATAHGIIVRFLNYSGGVHRKHLRKPAERYDNNDQIKLAILYVNPQTKYTALTELRHLVSPAPPPENTFADVTVSDVMEDCKVSRYNKRDGAYFTLPNKNVGYAYPGRLSTKANADLSEEFHSGTEHKCKVMGFDLIDNVVHVSCLQRDIDQKYANYSDFKPGDVIKCEVMTLKKDMLVKVVDAGHFKGRVRRLHLADVPLSHPEQKFKPGAKVKCRVLSVRRDPDQLELTCKPQLVRTKYPPVTAWSQLQRGARAQGTIVLIKDTGVLVTFYNGVKGWVPRKELSSEEIELPQKTFFVGQVVMAEVLHAMNLETEPYVVMTFKLGEGDGFLRCVNTRDRQVGRLYTCDVTEVTSEGLDVVLRPSGSRGFLAAEHLSDLPGHGAHLLRTYRRGDTLHEVLALRSSNVLVMTLKPLFIDYAKRRKLPMQLKDLRKGGLVPVYVEKHASYGLLLSSGNGLKGLAHKSRLVNKFVPKILDLFPVGASFVAMVTDVENSRVSFSLKVTDVAMETGDGLDLLVRALAEYDQSRQTLASTKKYAALSELSLGQVVSCTVDEVTDTSATLTLPGGVKGVSIYEHMHECSLTSGAVLEGVVLYVDVTQRRAEVLLNPEPVRLIAGLNDNKLTQAQEGQHLKSVVLTVQSEFVLALLQSHAAGRLAYLPARRHLNDVTERYQYKISQENTVIVKRHHEGQILATLAMNEPTTAKMSTECWTGKKVMIGTVVLAKVIDVKEFELHVSYSRYRGRVHITELHDNTKDGTYPLHRHKVGHQVKVRVLGTVRFAKKQFVTPGEDIPFQFFLECAMKESVFDLKQKDVAAYLGNLAVPVDRPFTAYVQAYHAPLLWLHVDLDTCGRSFLLQLSDDVTVLNSPEEHFRPGRACAARLLRMLRPGVVELSLLERPLALAAGVTTHGLVTSQDAAKGLQVQLDEGYKGVVHPCDLLDHEKLMEVTEHELFWKHENPTEGYPAGLVLPVTLKTLNEKNKHGCTLVFGHGGVKNPVDKEDFPEGSLHVGIITGHDQRAITVTLSRKVTGRALFSDIADHRIITPAKVLYTGRLVKVKVVGVENGQVRLSLKEEDTGMQQIPPAYLGSQRSDKNDVKVKPKPAAFSSWAESRASDDDDGSEGDDVTYSLAPEDCDVEMEEEISGDSGVEDDLPVLSVPGGFEWCDPAAGKKAVETGGGQSDDEDETSPAEHKPPVLKKPAKKVPGGPETVTDYEQLVAANPNRSSAWISYMTFLQEQSNTEAARALADRALNTIFFREESEKMKVWVAYLQLEQVYGTQETLRTLFDRAVQYNDPLKIHNHMARIHEESGKIEQADALWMVTTRKFKDQPAVWADYATFLFKQNKLDVARRQLQRALSGVDKRNHVEVIAKFAHLEFIHGDKERGKTMYEQVLASYPRRTDIWSVYIDQLLKAGDVTAARGACARATSLDLPARRMRTLFQKHLELEQRHGTAASVCDVKRKAVRFVGSVAKTTDEEPMDV